ncbi:MAG: depupylase/deamidase Dop [Actinomycetota bacterium]|nr:depupylase/deamidase Dop [Actinomycetota bacterium]
MAIAKVCGIETEYGVLVVSPDEMSPTTASSLLINAYVARLERKIGWDFEDESPQLDARGFAREGSMPPEVETHLVNAVLTNGARYYVDHAHPEYSTPECSTPLEVVLHDRAGEVVLRRSMEAAKRLLPPGDEIIVHKNNSDGKGNSYGCHENYLLDRQLPFARVVQRLTPHLVTRQVYCGAGKVGQENGADPGSPVRFQISQRADFFEEEVGLETTLKRPIINTRDEPHADPQKYRRLHVIVGDANLSEVATFLKVGVTAIVLAMIEDDFDAGRDLTLASPVAAIRGVSHDPGLDALVELASGARLTAVDLQWELHGLARKYAEERGLEFVGGEEAGSMVLDRWERVLQGLETEPESLAGEVDWIAKKRLVDGYRERHRLEWSDQRLNALDLQYHDLRPEKSLFARLDMERLVAEPAVERAVTEPPETTRAYFRGRCLAMFSAAIVAANWDSVVFDVGHDPLRRVPMMEPLRGTAKHVATLFEECEGPAELLRRLGS